MARAFIKTPTKTKAANDFIRKRVRNGPRPDQSNMAARTSIFHCVPASLLLRLLPMQIHSSVARKQFLVFFILLAGIRSTAFAQTGDVFSVKDFGAKGDGK